MSRFKYVDGYQERCIQKEEQQMDTKEQIMNKYLTETLEGAGKDLRLNKCIAVIVHSEMVSYEDKLQDIDTLKDKCDNPADIKMLNRIITSMKRVRKQFKRNNDDTTYFVIKGQRKHVLYTSIDEAIRNITSYSGKIMKVKLLEAKDCRNVTLSDGVYEICEGVATYTDGELMCIKGLTSAEYKIPEADIYIPELTESFKAGDIIKLTDCSDVIGVIVDEFDDNRYCNPKAKTFRDNRVPVLVSRFGKRNLLKHLSVFKIEQITLADLIETKDIVSHFELQRISEYKSQVNDLMLEADVLQAARGSDEESI